MKKSNWTEEGFKRIWAVRRAWREKTGGQVTSGQTHAGHSLFNVLSNHKGLGQPNTPQGSMAKVSPGPALTDPEVTGTPKSQLEKGPKQAHLLTTRLGH